MAMSLSDLYPGGSEILAEFGKNDRGEVVRVVKGIKRGKTYMDIRTYYPQDGQLWVGKGVAINIADKDKIIEALSKVEA